MKCAFVDQNRHRWPVSMLCEALKISPSGYHQRQQRSGDDKPRRCRISNDALLAHIKAIHVQVKGEYGWPRMWKELVARGVRVGKERVRKLMAQHDSRTGPPRRRYGCAAPSIAGAYTGDQYPSSSVPFLPSSSTSPVPSA